MQGRKRPHNADNNNGRTCVDKPWINTPCATSLPARNRRWCSGREPVFETTHVICRHNTTHSGEGHKERHAAFTPQANDTASPAHTLYAWFKHNLSGMSSKRSIAAPSAPLVAGF